MVLIGSKHIPFVIKILKASAEDIQFVAIILLESFYKLNSFYMSVGKSFVARDDRNKFLLFSAFSFLKAL